MPDSADNFCYRHPDRQSFVVCQRCGRTICPECQTPAAVGVICPEDMREQRRTAPRTTPPLRRRIARLGSSGKPVVVYSIIAITLVVWVLQLVPRVGDTVTAAMLFNPVYLYPDASLFQPWRMLTSLFVHSPSSIFHVLFNMFSLFIFGRILEPMLGRWRFLALYLISGIGGSLAVVVLGAGSVIGASGAIFGLMGAFFLLARTLGGDIRAILGIIVLNLLSGFFIPSISWQAHVGGLIVGLIVAAILLKTRTERRDWVQPAALGATAFALVAAGTALVFAFV
ncbi:rhomboid family intramembrane serine protease [Planctomonas psychrotolerans]|uniref:rhomboid family intramembrane serine protease n=1 Tax=Planctomonas psychrotolerans TaxID=2528712 RepID=UPI00123B1581|nr:rhomboid family intramembrane serine protease [Planctomonas psychrotolerans]